MFRSSKSVVALCAALLATSAASAADYDGWGEDSGSGGFRSSYPAGPGDWVGLADADDPVTFESGVRYWYSWGSQDFSSAGASVSSTDNAHIGELHLRIDDHSTNVYAKALAGYSMKIDGDFSGTGGGGAVTAGAIGDGHVGYVGADIGWNVIGDHNGSGIGPLVGYLYWQDAPNTGRFNFTTATSGADIPYDPLTGQTFVPGDSAPNFVETHALRLGIGGKAKLGDFFDISGEVAGVPYAHVSGTVGADDVAFNTSVYGGQAQPPYGGDLGNISSIRSSVTSIDGWGYGAMAEGWLGVHPTENLAFRLGGRLWYLQGTVDATFTQAQIGNPGQSNPPAGNYDQDPSFVNGGFISTSNPFKMMRYGILGELTYSF
jgi:hypothetical protein